MSKRKKPDKQPNRVIRTAAQNGHGTIRSEIGLPPPPPRPVEERPRRRREAVFVTIAIIAVIVLGLVMAMTIPPPAVPTTPAPTVPALAAATGQSVDGIACQSSEQLKYHVHAHLAILDNGKAITVPAQIGIPSSCFYWLHTHDTTGVIHIEAPSQQPFTLGQFFDIWGQPLSTSNVAGHQGTVTAYVDGRKFIGDPRTIPLADHESITLEIGKTVPPPPNYNFGSLP